MALALSDATAELSGGRKRGSVRCVVCMNRGSLRLPGRTVRDTRRSRHAAIEPREGGRVCFAGARAPAGTLS